ncbi:MAG: hypothetical protein M3144_05395 [Actinomycetota bacterium]|nr:hypothetical protein [Actinomycetota bacterium]
MSSHLESPPVKPRHYQATPDLVRRTQGDLSPEHLQARARRGPFVEELAEPKPSQPRLVSTAQGAFGRLLLTIPGYAVQSAPLATVFQDLLGKLPAAAGVVILTHESVEGDVRQWLRNAGREGAAEVITAPDHLHFSVWAEDGYVVVTDADEGRTSFVEPYAFPRYGDGLIADFVSNATDLGKTQAPLYFQGGNVLIGDDFFLIGADYPAESLQYVNSVLRPEPGESPRDLVRRLYSEYLDTGRRLLYIGSTIPVPAEEERTFLLEGEEWRELVYVGNQPGTVQPLFHIDMFITLVGRDEDGRYRVLVGDPALAAELLGETVRPHAMREVYDNVARGMERLGFSVTRNPLPLVYVDDPRARFRIWYFATSNNALVEIGDDGQNRVLMPTYGHGVWSSLEVIDRRNREIFEGLGFEVVPLGDFHPFAENLGAVHCIKKYLARSTP